ncbi:hypothetical protein Droror1_Dr00003785 [Drosera rotundifolia]
MEQRKHNVLDNKEGDEILVGVPFNVGSTSKSSSEWRSLMQDSTTDDPFSSSSRRNGLGSRSIRRESDPLPSSREKVGPTKEWVYWDYVKTD